MNDECMAVKLLENMGQDTLTCRYNHIGTLGLTCVGTPLGGLTGTNIWSPGHENGFKEKSDRRSNISILLDISPLKICRNGISVSYSIYYTYWAISIESIVIFYYKNRELWRPFIASPLINPGI